MNVNMDLLANVFLMKTTSEKENEPTHYDTDTLSSSVNPVLIPLMNANARTAHTSTRASNSSGQIHYNMD